MPITTQQAARLTAMADDCSQLANLLRTHGRVNQAIGRAVADELKAAANKVIASAHDSELNALVYEARREAVPAGTYADRKRHTKDLHDASPVWTAERAALENFIPLDELVAARNACVAYLDEQPAFRVARNKRGKSRKLAGPRTAYQRHGLRGERPLATLVGNLSIEQNLGLDDAAIGTLPSKAFKARRGAIERDLRDLYAAISLLINVTHQEGSLLPTSYTLAVGIARV